MLQRSMLGSGEVGLPWVSVHSSICETVIQCSGVPVYLCSQEGGQVCHGYLCILLYVKLIQCSGIPVISAHKQGRGIGLPWVSVHSSICGSDLV